MIAYQKESRQIRRNRQRKTARENTKVFVADKEAYNHAKFLLSKVLHENQLEKLAQKFGIIERKRKLTALALISVLMMGCVCDTDDKGIRSLRRMCLLLRSCFKIRVKPEALQKKINTKETSEFTKEIMSMIMTYKVDKFLKKFLGKCKGKVISIYRILLQDSTVISLPDSLKRIFRGCGGAASEAAIKCDFIIDQSNHLVIRVKLVGGRVPDVKMSSDIIDFLEEDDLVIRDLGYFNLSQLTRIISKDANFISRLSKTTNIYLNKNDKEPLNIIEHLKTLGVEKGEVDTKLYAGKLERIYVRLIGIKVPQEVVEARRQKYKENRKKKEPSEELQEWKRCN